MFCCWFTKLVDGFNVLPGRYRRQIAITGGIVLALTAIATVMGVVLAAVGMVVSGIGALGVALGTLATSLGIAGGVAGLLSRAAVISSNSFRCSSGRCWCWGISIQRVSKATEDSIASVISLCYEYRGESKFFHKESSW